jgi:hypothetical protein
MDNSRNVDGAISGGDQIAVWAGGQIAVAGGTFSLPVELPEMPEGGVQMDFSYPAGDPELAIVAVHQDVIRTTWAGGVAIAAILVLWVLGLACRRVARARKAH